jgi:hypothetical protein
VIFNMETQFFSLCCATVPPVPVLERATKTSLDISFPHPGCIVETSILVEPCPASARIVDQDDKSASIVGLEPNQHYDVSLQYNVQGNLMVGNALSVQL